jgi:predicted peptidase
MLKRFASIPSLLFTGALLFGSSLHADTMGDWLHMKAIQPKGYVCGFSNTPVVVDGKLDDTVWLTARWTDEFVDIEGEKKPKPRQRTRAKMAWDADCLYIAAELLERHLQGTITTHDAVIFQDNDFEVFLDPDGNNHDYVELELNALNTTWDLSLTRPYKDQGHADNRWEFEGLRSAVHLQGTLNNPQDEDIGWTLEIAIPWSAFGKRLGHACPPNEGDRWHINFSRVEWQFDVVDGKYIKKPNTKEDNWVWSPQGIIDMHRPERWGSVQFTRQTTQLAEFVLDENGTARDTLMEIYHRQRAFHSKNKKWASSLKELGVTSEELPTCNQVSIQLDADGYRASYAGPSQGVPQRSWNVRQDSRLWTSWRTYSELSQQNPSLEPALSRAGENRPQLELAIEQAPPNHLEAIEFLIANMPDRDLQSLSASFLLENARLALDAWNVSPWHDSIPKEIFLNNILPYANINESRDDWRRDFRERFLPLIDNAKTPSQAAAMINQKLFPLVKVRYSTQRSKADQSPIESIKSGLASCTGLSILLIDACRACGIPARFVGTPLWSDKSGNHSWVEVWDHGWHFTGAAEPNGDELDKAWFIDRASTAVRDERLNAIYAVSFQRTPLAFPLVWDRSIDYIHSVNVSDRYTQLKVKRPEGTTKTMFRIVDQSTGKRVAAQVKVTNAAGTILIEGVSNDERFDSNDHLSGYLPTGSTFTVHAILGDRSQTLDFKSEPRDKPIEIIFVSVNANQPKANPEGGQANADKPLEALKLFLAKAEGSRSPLEQVSAFRVPISRTDAVEATQMLWKDRADQIRRTRAPEMENRELAIDNLKMPFAYKSFGSKPASGRSLYISMHGGGGAPARVNTQQWENQKKLYELEEGIYVAPRAPTDTWDLWHQSHIDRFMDRLIENMIVFEEVNPNRVYLMGYSAGGDGVFQLAPRMADRFAAAAMMAGHPNETSPLGLRNLPFTIHMGGNDAAYNRNKVAAEWAEKLADLKKSDPNGYEHLVKIHEGKGHWMDRQDAVALPWMSRFDRNPNPTRIVWKQDDVLENRFYWLGIEPANVRDRALINANREGQIFDIDSKDIDRVRLLLNDSILDFEKPMKVTSGNKVLFEGRVVRTIASIAKSLQERADLTTAYQAEVIVELGN